ncbi:hypothetical protein F5884DRAFT_855092 [Xylogone sp. PMI_703]|nr:hypothetical protein F5884DRAFT_855092 [Xylogone sp. PMI_703]
MSGMDRKSHPPRAVHRVSGKSPIAAPPRVALQGRSSKSTSEHHHLDEGISSPSVNSATSTPPEGGGVVGGTVGVGSGMSYSSDDGEPLLDSGAKVDAKDKKIMELEKEISIMEDEFQRELTQLSLKLTNEAETATFWQQKHSALNQTFLKTDAELRLLRQDMTTMQSQSKDERDRDRDRDIKTRISSLILDRDAFREAYNEAMGEVKGLESTVRSLQSQVAGLKSFVSTSSKMDEQVADEAFGESMQKLGNGLQNWVITNFRRAKIDVGKASDEAKDELLQLVPTYADIVAISKIHLIMSIVSRLFIEFIFNPYFVGLTTEQEKHLKDVEQLISGYGTTESLNQWRSNTLAMLRKGGLEKMQKETTTVVDSLVDRINHVMDSISDIKKSEARDQPLRAMIINAIDLSRLLRVQKAVFSIIMPLIEGHQRTVFDAESMEDIGGEDEDTLQEKEILCVTFPGVVKIGDENGEHTHLRNVVAKAKVLCAPE